MSGETQPSPSGKPQTTGFAYEAAKASWTGPIVIFLLLMFGHQVTTRAVLDLIALGLILVGLSCAVIALCGIRKHGRKGILAPALVGIVLNGLLLFIFITNFMAARAAHLPNASMGNIPQFGNQGAAIWVSHPIFGLMPIRFTND